MIQYLLDSDALKAATFKLGDIVRWLGAEIDLTLLDQQSKQR